LNDTENGSNNNKEEPVGNSQKFDSFGMIFALGHHELSIKAPTYTSTL